jgi:hypothetical protein
MSIWLEEAQNGLMVFDAAGDVINLGIDFKKGDIFAATLDGFSIFLYGSLRSFRFLKGIPSPRLLNPPINITATGLKHTIERHVNLSMFQNRSKFFLNINIIELIQNATQHPMTRQSNGFDVRIVDAGKNIGIDRVTGKPTNLYTVVTNPNGELVSAYPGLP